MKPWKTNPFSQCFKSVQQFLFWHYLYFSSLNYNHNFHCFLCFPFYPTSIHEHLFHFCSIIFTEFSINFLLRIESTFCKLPLFWAQSFISSLKWLLAYQLACFLIPFILPLLGTYRSWETTCYRQIIWFQIKCTCKHAIYYIYQASVHICGCIKLKISEYFQKMKMLKQNFCWITAFLFQSKGNVYFFN